ncbi:MAG: hypothetical protein LQ342_005561 [Letrouitia transgressa]|nr:MAG: hypothetical protein LQ342_005561 [Letrouitia transgressa]
MDIILDTPAKRRRLHPTSNQEYDSTDDRSDNLFQHYETVSTVPLPRSQPGPTPLSPSSYITQPTQVINSPEAKLNDSTKKTSIVQVVASSPLREPLKSATKPPQSRKAGAYLANALAPPGTTFRPPQRASKAPSVVELSDDDDYGPVYRGGSSDDDLQKAHRADIKPSAFTQSKPGASRFQEIISNSSYKPLKENKNEIKPLLSGSVFDPKGHERWQSTSTLSTDRKRSADIMANAYGNATKQRNQIHRDSPSMSNSPYINSLEEIEDFQVRNKVERMQKIVPGLTLNSYRDALLKKRDNFEDAMDLLMSRPELSETIDLTKSDNERPSRQNPVSTKPHTKQTLKAPAQSIQAKWTATQSFNRHTELPKPASPTVITSKPRKRLVQGLNNSANRHDASNGRSERTPEAAANSDSALGSEQGESELERKVLEFLNSSDVKDLIDIAGVSEMVATSLLSHRPFPTLENARNISVEYKADKKRPAKKPVGDKIVDKCIDMWNGYEAVDELVEHCGRLGKLVANEINKWGVNIYGSTEDGELELVSFDQKHGAKATMRDSGIGTPTSRNSSGDDEQDNDAGMPFIPQPSLLSKDVVLKDYQIVGVNWLSLLFKKKLSCILADDMGLGKTCQVIAFLAHLLEKGNNGPHLVIVPGSTIENWLREFSVFCPQLSVIPYYGKSLPTSILDLRLMYRKAGQSERFHIQEQIKSNIEGINVIVTTYGIAKTKRDTKFLRSLEFQVCVFDEGHTLKNSKSTAYGQLMRIPASFRTLLTGTPLQNNLSELVSLLAFIMPAVFKKHSQDLDYVFSHKAKTAGDSHAALLSAQRIDRARSMMAPFILRRKKYQVLKHLPAKKRHVEYCSLLPSQLELYQSEQSRAFKDMADRAAGKKIGNDSANIMMSLRKASIHPLLFRQLYDDNLLKEMARSCQQEPQFFDTNLDMVYEDMTVMTDFELNRFCHKYPSTMARYQLQNEEWMDSGKVNKLVQILTRFKENGDRVLLFSQFVLVMDILENVMETLGIRFFRLDGQTKIEERQDMIDEFHQEEDITVFMLSTKAGGAGINLACANKVVIFDSSFNPQEDIQAENRAHRVGQTREVEVVRLVTTGTIEEQIYALGQTKLALDDRIAGHETEAEDGQQAEKQGAKIVEEMMIKQMNEGKQSQEDP